VPQAPRQCHKHSSGSERLEFYSVAKVCQTFDQALFLLVGGTAIEVVAAEVAIHRAVLEHVVMAVRMEATTPMIAFFGPRRALMPWNWACK